MVAFYIRKNVNNHHLHNVSDSASLPSLSKMWGQNDRPNLCFSPVLIIFLLQFSCPGRLFQHDSKCYNYIFKSKHLKSVVFACSQKTFPFNLYMLGMVRNYHPISSIDIVRFCELLIHLPLPSRTVSVSYFLKICAEQVIL